MSGDLKLASVLQAGEPSLRVRPLDETGSLEAGYAGILVERNHRAGEGDLVALDMSTQPPEIAHVFPGEARRENAEAAFSQIAARPSPSPATRR